MCFHGGRSSLYSSYQIYTRRRRATAAAAHHRIGHQFTLSDGGVLPSACHPHSPSLLNNQHLLLFVGLGASSCVCIRGGLSQISQFKFWFGRRQCNIIIRRFRRFLGCFFGRGPLFDSCRIFQSSGAARPRHYYFTQQPVYLFGSSHVARLINHHNPPPRITTTSSSKWHEVDAGPVFPTTVTPF